MGGRGSVSKRLGAARPPGSGPATARAERPRSGELVSATRSRKCPSGGIRLRASCRFLVYNRRSLRQRQTRRKAGTQSHGPTSSDGYGSRAAEGTNRVGVCSPHPLRIEGILLPPPRSDGEIAVASINPDARFVMAANAQVRTRLPRHGVAQALPTILCASTGEVGRSHVPHLPDPDPRASDPRAARRPRLSEVATYNGAARRPSAGRVSLPDRARGLHSLRPRPTSRTALSA
jgi:hypothetical protein